MNDGYYHRGNREPGAEPRLFVIAGAPTNGTSGTGAGECFPGELLIDQTNGNVYVNRGTKASQPGSRCRC